MPLKISRILEKYAEKAVSSSGADVSNSTPQSAKNYDKLLVQIGQNQNKQAFIEIFEYFAPRIKSFLMKGGISSPEAAEELMQETMLTIWDKAESYNPSQAAASTWIFTIARNKRIDALRKIKAQYIDPDLIFPSIKDENTPNPEQRFEDLDTQNRVAEALKSLPPEQAQLLRLSFFEDMAHGEIAAKTKLPLGTVKSRIRLAMERLRKSLKPTDYGR